jgi:quinol monooxygenase YgiN
VIHVIAVIELKRGARGRFLEIFQDLVPKVRAEEGCIAYGPTIDAKTDIARQKVLGENAVVILERWESLAHLKAHLEAAHMADYREQVEGLVVGSELRVLAPA